jgi:hypothetical protein
VCRVRAVGLGEAGWAGWVRVGRGWAGGRGYMCSDLLPIGPIVGKHGAGDHWILWRAVHLDRPLGQPAKDNGAATDNKLWRLFHPERPRFDAQLHRDRRRAQHTGAACCARRTQR